MSSVQYFTSIYNKSAHPVRVGAISVALETSHMWDLTLSGCVWFVKAH